MRKLLILITMLILILFIYYPIYYFDKIITPNLLAVGDAQLRIKCLEIINEEVSKQCNTELTDSDLIHIEKDKDNNVVFMRADVMKMNRMAINISLESQKKLIAIGDYGIKIPLGYALQNNFFAYFGPRITVKMEPLGYIEVKYNSQFESAGINQTREKIYLTFSTTVRIILPRKSNTIIIENQVPISDTIIVGKIPNTALQLDLMNAGYKKNNP